MVATSADILIQQAAGKYVVRTASTILTTANTAATATSGFLNLQFSGTTGSVFPNTITSCDGPASVPSDLMFLNLLSSTTAGRHSGIGRIYRLGTCDFTVLGEAFTPDAATFPLLRNEMGATNVPQSFIPIMQVTTNTGGTAAQFQIRNAGSTAGYVNSQGTTVVGSKTFTFPSGSTQVNSTYFLPLNDGDYSCRNITNITCTTISTNAFATIWLLEDLGIGVSIGGAGITDHLYGSGLRLTQCAPATATTGTATSALVPFNIGNTAALTAPMYFLSLGIVP